MQLLPSTARLVARRAEFKIPRTADLYKPETNIRLGSYHLARLAERYQRSRPLMAAAYNAGEHRVDRWIADASGTPMDVWVEGIPFRETRNYVKNIVAFSHVYSRILGQAQPVLAAYERRVP
jgi:soluble lytic murein transglycosylase